MRLGLAFLVLALPAAGQTAHRFPEAPFPAPGTSYRLVRTGQESAVDRALGLERLHQEPTIHRSVRLEGEVEVGRDSNRLRIDRASLANGPRRVAIDLVGRELEGRGWLFDVPGGLGDGEASLLRQTLHPMGSIGVLRSACRPVEPVAPGDFWLADAEPFVHALGLDPEHVDLDASSATCHLERVYGRGDRTFGVLGFDVDITPRIVDGHRVWRGRLRYQGRVESAIDAAVPWGRAEFTYDLSTETRFRVDGRIVSVLRRTTGRGTEEILPPADAPPAPRSERSGP